MKPESRSSTPDLIKEILSDTRVELLEAFDRNFERKAFFSDPWPKRRREGRGSLLIVGGRLRRSIRGEIRGRAIYFGSDTPYASIHNNGGRIRITPKMRRYFWAQFYKNAPKTTGGGKRSPIRDADALFWRNMAISKKKEIEIPKRRFIGQHSQVKKIVRENVGRNLDRFMRDYGRELFGRLNRQ